jgi:hypothetical protein
MRKRQTFLLTVLTTEESENEVCGQVKVISSGKAFTFINIEEFKALLLNELFDTQTVKSPGNNQ